MKTEKMTVFGLVMMLVVGSVAFVAGGLDFGLSEEGIDSGIRDTPIMIYNVDDLQAMRDDLSAHYILANDIDASETSGWNDGEGFEPIGSDETPFTGSIDGRSHTVFGLHINITGSPDTGLLGYNDGIVKNLHMEDILVRGGPATGGIAGFNTGAITNSSAQGYVEGDDIDVGLIAGRNSGTISRSFSDGEVYGADWNIGGLAGRVSNTGVVENSHSGAKVTGDGSQVGGLVGGSFNGQIIHSYSTGISSAAGLVGWSSGTCSHSFWDTETSGTTSSGGGVGKTTEEMMDPETFWAWDLEDTWWIVEGLTYPLLMFQEGLFFEISSPEEGETVPNTNVRIEWIGGSALNEIKGYEIRLNHGGWVDVELNTNHTYPELEGGYHTVDVRLFYDETNKTDSVTFFALKEDGSPEYPYLIYDVHDLQNISSDLNIHYALAGDIDASETVGWNGGEGFDPIGNDTFGFSGSLDGRNYTIAGLHIDRPDTDNVGLFGYTENTGIVKNVGLVDHYVRGHEDVGGLVGYNGGTVEFSYTTGQTIGEYQHTGGLVGYNRGTVRRSHSSGGVEGYDQRVGGLVGNNYFGSIFDSYATGNVTGHHIRVGGLAGFTDPYGTIENSYATGHVFGLSIVGGFLGDNWEGTVKNCYSTGTVNRLEDTFTALGGFLGRNHRGIVEDCYSTGSVHYQEGYDDPDDKGFVGAVDTAGDYLMTGNYWDMETSGQTGTSGEATGRNTSEMKDTDNFVDWDMVAVEDSDDRNTDHIWNMVNNETYPFLSWQELDLTEIYTWIDLHGIRNDKNERYVLMNDLTPDTEGYHEFASEDANGGEGFEPIGSEAEPFNGIFEGRGHEIIGLYTFRNVNNVGLFGYIGTEGVIDGVNLIDVTMIGNVYVGGLAGVSEGIVSSSYTSGSISGTYRVGGLVGRSHGLITQCGSTSSARALRDVSWSEGAGGLVAENHGTIESSYAAGDVSVRTRFAGGFVGHNYGNISHSYSTGDVTRARDGDWHSLGGFAGDLDANGRISNSYSTGRVIYSGTDDPTDRGFLGTGSGYLNSNFWDVDTSGQVGSQGEAPGELEGKSTIEMKTQSTFTDWDFDYIWHMAEGTTYPLLQWQEICIVDLTVSPESDGWNLISFNVDPGEMSLVDILEHPEYGISGSYDRLMYYHGGWFSYVPGRASRFNDVSSWNHTMGVWIKMNSNATILVEGEVPVSTDIILHHGWNMVGLPVNTPGNYDLPVEVIRIGYFDAAEEYNIVYTHDVAAFEFQPGKGYWVYNGGDEVTWRIER